jgi:DEAD/DEAH box helicase domain-containing protein
VNWREITAKAGEARRAGDYAALLALWDQTNRDGWVALQCGGLLAHRGQRAPALWWLHTAEEDLPLPRYKETAREEIARAALSPSDARPVGDTLYVVACTKTKAWDDSFAVPPVLPAQDVYQGKSFRDWLESPEHADGTPWVILSAKYGLIPPDLPLTRYDVTFARRGDPVVGDRRLGEQARWRPGVLTDRPLTDFARVEVIGSETYRRKVEEAFRGTGARVAGWKPDGPTALAPAVDPSRAQEVGEVLGDLPLSVYRAAEEGLPDWRAIESLGGMPTHLAALAVIGIAINNYALPARAERYWEASADALARAEIRSADDVERALAGVIRGDAAVKDERGRKQKLARLQRLMGSEVPDLLARSGEHVVLDEVWSALADGLNNDPEMKAVVYAVRTVALLYRSRTGRDLPLPAELPVPVDVRLVQLALASGVVRLPGIDINAALAAAGDLRSEEHRPVIIDGWRQVADAAGCGAMTMDALLWRLGRCVEQGGGARAAAEAELGRVGVDPAAAARLAEEVTWLLPGRDAPGPPEPPRPPFDLDGTWDALQPLIGDAVIATRELPEQPAVTAPFPDVGIHPAVREAVTRRLSGADLYSHQVRAVGAAVAGQDVVVETATASGKTLCYQVPILDALLRDSDATALYLAPVNALVEDQLDGLGRLSSQRVAEPPELEDYVKTIRLGDDEVAAARYDSGVDTNLRARLRGRPYRFVITNPDMLSRAILAWSGNWEVLLRGLRFVVVDEMHVYRGLFGAHLSNVLRRLRRLCARVGAEPQFIGCSASIADPDALFGELVGRRAGCVIRAADGGAPRHRRRLAVIDSARVGGGEQVGAGRPRGNPSSAAAEELVADLMRRDSGGTICFMRSIRGVDVVHEGVVGRLGSSAGATVRSFKREIPVETKREIGDGLRTGRVRAVIATTALQMGIDIGDLSVAVIGGFPGTRAAFMQSAGRVGRQGPSLVLLLLDQAALDQHFAREPDELFDPQAERAYLRPDYDEVVRRHLLAAAVEAPIDLPRDRDLYWPTADQAVEELVEAGALVEVGSGRFEAAPDQAQAAMRIDLRSTVGFDCPFRVNGRGKPVATVDAARAYRNYHPDAILYVDGHRYVVTDLQMDWRNLKGEGVVVAAPRDAPETTPAVTQSAVSTGARQERASVTGNGGKVSWGGLRVTVSVPGYYTQHAHGRQYTALGSRALAPWVTNTFGVRVDVPWAWLTGVEGGEDEAALRSVAQALRIAGALKCTTDLADIGAILDEDESKGGRVIHLSDMKEGGTGISEMIFDEAPAVVASALAILRDCPNCSANPRSRGCPQCALPDWASESQVNRTGAIAILELLVADLALIRGSREDARTAR